MKTNYLLYDDNCPFCVFYTKWMLNQHMLSPDSRIPYTSAILLPEFEFNHEKAKNKIALIVKTEGKPNNVLYGIDSLLEIIGNKFKLIKFFGKLPIIYQFLQLFYSLISFNRKVIAPSQCEIGASCEPTFSVSWRIIFIAIASVFVMFSTEHYFRTFFVNNYLCFKYGEVVWFLLQFAFQAIFFVVLKQKRFLVYCGHLAVIGLVGALLLSVIQFVLQSLQLLGLQLNFLPAFSFGIVYAIMFWMHATRIKKEKFDWKLSITWTLYRFIIYPFLFEL